MRDTTTALYNGKEYDASVGEDGRITLISDDQSDVSRGFNLYRNIKYIKQVERNELEDLYEKKVKAIYKGYTCDVFEENGDKVLIMIDNILHETSKELKMDKAIDKGMYVKWIDKSEAEIRVEKKML